MVKNSGLSKIQFDKLALSWLEATTQVDEYVPNNIVLQTYRLTFDQCSSGSCKRNCGSNPRCISALGATGVIRDGKSKIPSTEDDSEQLRLLTEPAGLKNLGATCYLNSLLQVWFHNSCFREVVLQWNQIFGEEGSSPGKPETVIGQLQLIFCRLLKSKRKSVDPTALVELLGLDTEYQQDASECCALLFNLILEQLRAYGDGNLAHQLENAFRGIQMTVIKCDACNANKKVQQYFYNVILNVQGHRDVRQCLKSLGQSKKIEGDFKCSSCLMTKGAVTYEEFSFMPSVLNLQLMRYRYDAKTGSKKKLQTPIRFPEILDVSPYVNGGSAPMLYELKAVLVHIGNSANNGHYIANVKVNPKGMWYRLNDENVSVMKGRLDLNTNDIEEKAEVKKDEKSGGSANCSWVSEEDSGDSSDKKTNTPSRSSLGNNTSTDTIDTEAVMNGENSANGNKKKTPTKRKVSTKTKDVDDPNTFSSTGAYMLVYEKIEGIKTESVEQAMETDQQTVQMLHDYLEELLDEEQKEFLKMTAERTALRESAASKGLKLLNDFNEAYNALPYVPNEEYRFVLTTSLSKVFKGVEQRFKELRSALDEVSTTDSKNTKQKNGVTDGQSDAIVNSLICPHSCLSPNSTVLSKLKVISQKGATLIQKFCDTHGFPKPFEENEFIPQELCNKCVVLLGKRLQLSQKLASDSKTFNQLMKSTESTDFYYIDNKSFQSWTKLAESENLNNLGLDVDSERFNEGLLCPHGNLIVSQKKTVPAEAWRLLKSYFPNCVEYSVGTEECAACSNNSLAEKALAGKRASEMNILRQNLRGLAKFRRYLFESEIEACALHVEQANHLRKLLRTNKIDSPGTHQRNQLICEHDKCEIQTNAPELTNEIILVSLDEWKIIESTFGIKTLVKVLKKESNFQTDPEGCVICKERKQQEILDGMTNFENISIPVVKMTFDELIQKHSIEQSGVNSENGEPCSKRKKTGRGGRVPNARLVNLSSNETFVDLKVKIMAKFGISPILQALLIETELFRDQDGKTSVRDLGINKDTIIYVAEDLSKASDESEINRVKEEIGFGGTRLAR